MARRVSYNLRSSLEAEQVDYLAALRDGAFFNLYGIPVDIKVPKIENNLDEYINYVDDDFYSLKTVVVPKFDEYRTVLSQFGMTAEEDYPLEIIIPSALHLPRNSRIILNEYNAHESKISREWRVLSTEVKQLSNSKNYTNIAKCVPARSVIYKTSAVVNADCYVEFSEVDGITILENLKAYAETQVRVFPVDTNKQPDVPEQEPMEAICHVEWKIKLPSIIY